MLQWLSNSVVTKLKMRKPVLPCSETGFLGAGKSYTSSLKDLPVMNFTVLRP
jgi:hypothetical protein